jgi:predicted 3-demethylubiquinone-9 3-methyltransferase (glyoxalase superfamily)
LQDKWGVSWQIIPDALGRYLGDPNREKANLALQAMLKMKKIIVADLDKACAS